MTTDCEILRPSVTSIYGNCLLQQDSHSLSLNFCEMLTAFEYLTVK